VEDGKRVGVKGREGAQIPQRGVREGVALRDRLTPPL